ncbi:MAG TPA: helix-turn-helix domain-containing protein [Gemmatimonadaceae bacterium]|nr:helix-turn-helix domain-containing protein [Gemmatimonadaceae bacterium]
MAGTAGLALPAMSPPTRIARALATSVRSLSQLAQEAGFADQSHMTRLFARYFGITPAAYRDAMRTDVDCRRGARAGRGSA